MADATNDQRAELRALTERLRTAAERLPMTSGGLMMSLHNVRDGTTPPRVVDAVAATAIINQVEYLTTMVSELRHGISRALWLSEAEIYLPGDWICPTCGFVESKRILSAIDGRVGVSDSPALPCPNDGSYMERYTWKQHALDLRTMMGRGAATDQHIINAIAPTTNSSSTDSSLRVADSALRDALLEWRLAEKELLRTTGQREGFRAAQSRYAAAEVCMRKLADALTDGTG